MILNKLWMEIFIFKLNRLMLTDLRLIVLIEKD